MVRPKNTNDLTATPSAWRSLLTFVYLIQITSFHIYHVRNHPNHRTALNSILRTHSGIPDAHRLSCISRSFSDDLNQGTRKATAFGGGLVYLGPTRFKLLTQVKPRRLAAGDVLSGQK
jgi:hypothetical protein